MPFFARQNMQLHFEEYPGLVPHDTVCFHGNLASNAWWEPMIEVLRAQARPGYAGRLICAEWRGCGQSVGLAHENELHLNLLADDYNALLRELGVHAANVIAHSTGCLIALIALRRAPELYRRAVFLNPVGARGVQFGPDVRAAFTAMSRDRAFCETVMRGTVHGGSLSPALWNRIVDDAFHVQPPIWQGVPNMLENLDLRHELPFVRQPVLVLHGEQDTVLPIEPARELALALPSGQFEPLPGRGHSCNVEAPELFTSIAGQFLFG